MSLMLHPETQPLAVSHGCWPMFSGLLLTGVVTTLGLVAGLKSWVTYPVKVIGAARAAGARRPTTSSKATVHEDKRRGTMTSLLPRYGSFVPRKPFTA